MLNFSEQSTQLILFVLRWLHVFFGVIWIGHLYYFNFVQGAFFNETDASTKSNAIQKLVPRALWWFRYGALWTFLTGITYLGLNGHSFGGGYFTTSGGVIILTGSLLGILMASNVWFVIWPAQQVVIKSATQAATGGQAIPEAAARGARALVASRTNTLFSIPMLFFMTGTRHLPLQVSDSSNFTGYWVVVLILVGVLEVNALKGKLGPLTTIKGVIASGFALSAVMLALLLVFL